MHPALQDIVARIRDAAARGTPLRIAGGGSKDFLAERLEGEPLSTAGLGGIVNYEPSELFVTVRAGTPLAELEAVLAGRGQCLPFEPPHFGGSPTVGGMVAAGLSGPARASAGAVRDFVLGLELVNGRGELLVFGGQVMKNVAGYDVSRLMAGAWGTLGLVAELSLKVLPVAPAEATLRFELGQEAALRQLNAWGGRPLPLNASRWVDEGGLGTLYLRLRGAVAAVESACRALGGERQDEAASARDWQQCRDQALPWFRQGTGGDLWRLSVPQTAPVLPLPQPVLVEWHGGQRWLFAERAQAAQVREAALAVGGHATLFRAGKGAGSALASEEQHPAVPGGAVPRRFTPLAPPLDRIHRELKRQFDPAGIFNPGRLYPDL